MANKSNPRLEDVCQHLESLDLEDGFEVCTSCGLVLGKHYCYVSKQQGQQQQHGPEDCFSTSKSRNNNKNKTAHDRLEDICINNNIGSDILLLAIQLYDTMLSRSGNKSTKDELIASSLFEACVLLQAARTPQDISRMCGIPMAVFWKGADKNKLRDEDLNNAESYVRKACRLLGFDFANTERVVEGISKFENYVFWGAEKPQTKAAVILYHFCRSRFPHINAEEIARVCNVNKRGLLTCMTKLKSRLKDI